MKKSIWSTFLALVWLTILLSGCDPASMPLLLTRTPLPPTETLVPLTTTPTLVNTPMPTAITSVIKLTPSGADIVITKVEIVNEDAFGNKAAPGYQILYVWFGSADGNKIDKDNFYDASKDVYVMGNDGSKTNNYSRGLLSGEQVIGFTPPTSASKFTLFWPGNESIELSLSR